MDVIYQSPIGQKNGVNIAAMLEAVAEPGGVCISRLVAALLCLCFGIFGIHRFYAGKVRSAKAMLFTFGGAGLWYLTDIVIVLAGELSDDQGKKSSVRDDLNGCRF